MDAWQPWIGRTNAQSDILTPALVRRHRATIDLDPANPAPLPGIHWCLCLPDAATAELGEDGHPRRVGLPAGKREDARDIADSFLPPIDLPRRMWAGSEVALLSPIRVGATIERVTTIRAIAEKHGGSGRLAFVTLDHATSADGEAVVRETQTLVYREAMHRAGSPHPIPSSEREGLTSSPSPSGKGSGVSSVGTAAPVDPEAWPHHRTITPTETLLFRYSALTFNSHRIHYDLPYAREVEGYAGLVVHGPLTATLLLGFATRLIGPVAHFTFRAAAPAFAGDPLSLVAREEAGGLTLAALGPAGQTCVSATAR